ncbi:MAG: transketolase family protein, partial [Raoultibacter sp.]
DNVELELGKSYVLREGSDVTIVACGVEIKEALEAAELLSEMGISAEVIDAFSIKPFDKETLLSSVKKTGCVVVAEEHSIHGGLGSTVSEVLAQEYPCPCEFIGVKDRFGKSGEFDELLSYFELDAVSIVEAVKKATARKRIC